MGFASGASSVSYREPSKRHPETSSEWFTYILTMCLGVGSWVTINGVFQQLPILVDQPEGWSLPSYITVVIQLANVGPLLLLGMQRATGSDLTTGGVISGLLINILSMALLATGAWSTTMNIAGSEHSVVLLALIFTASSADCLSSVTFWPFIALFKLDYLYTSLSIGEGFSAVLPAILSFIQQPGNDNPLFSANLFFMLLGVMMTGVGFAFGLLVARVPVQFEIDDDDRTESIVCTDDEGCDRATLTMLSGDGGDDDDDGGGGTVIFPFFMLFSCSFLQNGALLSTQTFTTQPYSNVVYQVALSLSMFIEPIGSALAILYPSILPKEQLYWLSAVLLCTGYQLVLAGLSPNPPFRGSFLGPFLTVGTSTVASFVISYLKTVAMLWLKRCVNGGEVQGAMQRAGVAIQLGSFVGASLFFLLIVVLQVFEEASGSGSW